MAGYRLALIELLRDQLLYTPRRVLKEHVLRLYDLVVFHIHSQQTYPYDFICHRITGYRPASDAEALFEGRDLQADLCQMLLELSARATPSPSVFREPTFSLQDLSRLLDVSPRRLLGWQEHAPLMGCYVEDEQGRRLAFRFAAVLRFIRDNPALTDETVAEALVAPVCRQQVVAAAHRSRKRTRTLAELTEHLSRRLKLSSTLVEYVLASDLQEHPGLGVYQGLQSRLGESERRRAARLFDEGWRLCDIGVELGCERKVVYRAICREKAEEILTSEVTFVDSAEFHEPQAEDRIFDEAESLAPEDEAAPTGRRRTRQAPGELSEDLPPYIRDLYGTTLLTPQRERWLFRKYNFAKYRMTEVREEVRRRRYAISLIRAYRRYESEALACRQELVRSNLRLVVSIAKRHLGPQTDFEVLVSDGNMSLMRAIEKFDYTKGFKFSTYASWAIIKNFAKSIPEENYHLRVYVTGVPELMDEVAAERARESASDESPSSLRDTTVSLLAALSEREQFILAARFGLPEAGSPEPQTLEQIGRHLSLSRERIRQLEKRALTRLRELIEA